jgi:hypothetical protein
MYFYLSIATYRDSSTNIRSHLKGRQKKLLFLTFANSWDNTLGASKTLTREQAVSRKAKGCEFRWKRTRQ